MNDTVVQRAIQAAHDALVECSEYLHTRADAEFLSDGTVNANKEMMLLSEVNSALRALEPVVNLP